MATERIARDPRRVRRAPRPRGGRRRAPGRHGTARRAERRRRGLGRAPRRGVRRRPRGDRPDQGRGADLEAGGRGRRRREWVEGAPPPLDGTGRLTHLDDSGSARMVDVGAKDETRAPRPRRGAAADVAGNRGGARPRRRAEGRRARDREDRRDRRREAHRRADPARPSAGARLRRRRGPRRRRGGPGRARRRGRGDRPDRGRDGGDDRLRGRRADRLRHGQGARARRLDRVDRAGLEERRPQRRVARTMAEGFATADPDRPPAPAARTRTRAGRRSPPTPSGSAPR